MGVLENVRSKLGTLAWYARRPTLYRELARRVARFEVTTPAVQREFDRQKSAGRAWCEERVRDANDALIALGLPTPQTSLASRHPTLLEEARGRVEACPVTMGGPADLDLIYHATLALRPKRVVETGVASGWSSLAVLAALDELGEGELTSVDMPYAKMENEAWVGVAVPDRLRGRWRLLRMPDRDGIPVALEAGSITLAHHDSDKSVRGRRFAYDRLWAALEPGGLLLSDDVEDNLAFSEFAADVGREPVVVRKAAGNFAGAIRK